MTVTDPIYNLSERYASDLSTESKSWLRVYEDSTGGGRMNNTPVQRTLLFRVDNLEHFLVLSRSYLFLKFRLNDGGNPAAPVNDASIINGGNKLFRRFALRANGQTIDTEHNYAREAMNVMEILNHNVDYDTSASSRYLYIPETAEFYLQGNDFNQGTIDLANNPSFARRAAKFNNQNEVTCAIPLHKFFPFLRHFDKVVRGISWELEFELAPDAEILQRPGNAPCAFNWSGNGAMLFIDRRVPSLSVRTNLNEQLQAGFQLNGYEYVAYTTHRKGFQGNTTSEDFHVTAGVSKPIRVYVMFQSQANVTDKGQNTLNYETLGVKRLNVVVNGSPNPLEAYDLRWDEGEDARGDRARAYSDLIATRGLDVSPMSDRLVHGTINYDDWQLKYPIYTIDLNHVNDTEYSGTSEIVVHFDKSNLAPFDQAFYCYVIVEHIKVANISMSNVDSQIVVS